MAEGGVEHDHVERSVLQRERTRVALDEPEIREILRELSGLGDEDRDGSTPTTVPTPGWDASARATGPGPQPTSATRAAAGKPDIREVRLPHLTLLRIGRSQLEDVDEPFDDGRFGLGNRHVDVGQLTDLNSKGDQSSVGRTRTRVPAIR